MEALVHEWNPFKKLNKKIMKLERAYDAAEGKPLRQARIMKSAAAVLKKNEEYKQILGEYLRTREEKKGGI